MVQQCMQYMVYVYMVHRSSACRFVDSVQGRMQSFVLKSLHSKTTVTACSNLAHLCSISLVVSRLRIKDCREIRIRPEWQRQHRTVPVEASGKLVKLHSLGLFPPLGPKSLGMLLKAMMAVSSRLRYRLWSQRRPSGGLIHPYGISHLLT